MTDSVYDDLKAAMAEATTEGGEKPNDDLKSDLADALKADAGEPEAKKDEPEGKKTTSAEEAPDVPAAKPDPTKTEEAAKPDAEGVKLDDKRAPSSWSAKVREKWAELPEEVRAEVLRREESHANGVRKLQEEFTPVRQFTESLGGVIQEAASLGQAPVQYIQNLAAAERGLRSGAPEQRFEVLLNLADQYGLPLRQYLNLPAGEKPAVQQPAALPPQVQQELEASRQFRQKFEQDNVQSQIRQFSQDKEFFEDVRALMADFMDSGAKSLQDAYDRAIWAHPEVRQVLLERERKAATESATKQRRASAAGASVNSGSPELDVTTGEEDGSIEDIIRQSIKASTGRM